MANSTGEAQVNHANEIVGTWALQVSTPFGMQPITFNVERTGDTLSGTMRHERGAADVSNIQMRGPEFTAEAAITLKGTRITADIDGRIDGSEINGSVKVHLPIAPPVKFTGTREA
jgi:hypothetical protein